MPEFNPTRDVEVLFKGDSYSVSVDQTMRSGGWIGGQGVKWIDSPSRDEFLVTYSDGLYGGFLLWGSDEPADQYIAMVQQQPAYGYAVLCAGGWLMQTRAFERFTYASRLGGPLVPIVYTVGQRLVFSLRGLFTNEDEWTLSGDPRAPNGYFIANVVDVPRPNLKGEYYITLQTSI